MCEYSSDRSPRDQHAVKGAGRHPAVPLSIHDQARLTARSPRSALLAGVLAASVSLGATGSALASVVETIATPLAPAIFQPSGPAAAARSIFEGPRSQSTPIEERLLAQAKFWEDRFNDEAAFEALQKILKINPDNRQALFNLGRHKAKRGEIEEARLFVSRLQAAGAPRETIDSLLLIIRLYQDQGQLLEQARDLADAGRSLDALDRYQAIFGTTPPQGELAIEYYHTMSGIDGRWAPAVQGLEAELRRNPDNRRALFTLSEILTYKEETRREGLRGLQEFLDDSAYSERAVQAYRNGLRWLGATIDDRRLYEDYLARFPNDNGVRDKLTELVSPPIIENASAVVNQGYRDMFEERLDQAESAFRQALRENPSDANALSGLGMVRLKKEDFAGAEIAFEQSVQADPQILPKLTDAYNAAAFWRRYHAALEARSQSIRARENGNTDRARELLGRAEELLFEIVDKEVENGHYATLALASIYSDIGDFEQAEALFREVLVIEPDNPDVVVGLVNALQRQDKYDEAVRIGQKLSTDERVRIGLERVEAELMRTRAKAARDEGRINVARSELRAALRKTPENPWIRLEYGQLLFRLGEIRMADQVMDVLAEKPAKEKDEKIALAIFAMDRGRLNEVISLVEEIEVEERSPADQSLLDDARFAQKLKIAQQEAATGDGANARRMLVRLQSDYGGQPNKAIRIAGVYLAAGAPGTAVTLVRDVLIDEDQNDLDADSLILSAQILLEVGQRDDARDLLSALALRPGLPRQMRDRLTTVSRNAIIDRTRELIEQNRFAEAFEELRPLLDQPIGAGDVSEEGSVVLRLAGELHQEAGMPERALLYYQQAIAFFPKDLYAISGAVGAALEAKDIAAATEVLGPAIELMPERADLYRLAADVAESAGNTYAAIEALEAARRLERGVDRRGSVTPSASPFRHAANTWLGAMERRLAAAGFDPRDMQTAAATMPAANTASAADAGYGVDEGMIGDDMEAFSLSMRPMALQPSEQKGDPASGGVEPLVLAQADEDDAEASDRIRRLLRDIAAEENQERERDNARQPDPREDITSDRRTTGASSVSPLTRDLLESSSAAAFDIVSAPSDPTSRRLSDLRWQVDDIGSQFFGFRYRSGETGLSQILELKTDLKADFKLARGRAFFAATPTFVTASSTLTDPNDVRRFGSQATLDPEFQASQDELSDGGIGVSIGYEQGGFQLDLGTTPVGFEVVNFVGGASYTVNANDKWFITGEVLRRAVIDSVLSYAGAVDPVTGLTFGGVTRSGGRISVLRQFERGGIYGAASYQIYQGEEIDDNEYQEVTTGFYLLPIDERQDNGERQSLNVGYNMTYFGFEENQRFFTLGQGGYFSPQSFLSASVPVEYRVEKGRLNYGLSGALGLQFFEEDDVDYFVNDSVAQAQAATVAAASEGTAPPVVHEGNEEVQLSFRAGGDVNYRVADRVEIGARVQIDNVADFTETQGGVNVRYRFGGGSR